MAKEIRVKLEIILFFLIFIFLISIPLNASTTTYSIATQFTFSSDMNMEEGFQLIKPYILYENDTISTKDYTFTATQEEGDWYHYTGTYPDGSPFSIHASIFIIDNASGTYVEALKREPYRQSIYIKGLKENQTANSCLLECWKNRFVTIKEPTYLVTTETTTRIYNHLTTFTISTGEVKQLQYFAMVKKNETPPEEVGFPKEPTLPAPDIPSEETPTTPNLPESPDNVKEESKETQAPFKIALICLGVLLSIVLIYLIIKGVLYFKKWLKK